MYVYMYVHVYIMCEAFSLVGQAEGVPTDEKYAFHVWTPTHICRVDYAHLCSAHMHVISYACDKLGGGEYLLCRV